MQAAIKNLLLTLLALFIFSISYSQESATLYLLRSTGSAGSINAFTAFVSDSLVCKLNNNKYSVHQITPGKHTVSVQFAGKKPNKKAERIEIEMLPGKSYYVQLIIKSGWVGADVFCTEITGASATMFMKDLKIDDKCL